LPYETESKIQGYSNITPQGITGQEVTDGSMCTKGNRADTADLGISLQRICLMGMKTMEGTVHGFRFGKLVLLSDKVWQLGYYFSLQKAFFQLPISQILPFSSW
jgi:hypothetical protein